MVQRVKDIMNKDITIVDGLTKVSDALQIMKDKHIYTVLIKPRSEEDVYGLLTLRDIARRVIAPMRRMEEVHVYEIMSKPVLTVNPNMPVSYAARFLTNFNKSWAPVLENDQVVGMISLSGIVLNQEEF